jgi:hypothetical protein
MPVSLLSPLLESPPFFPVSIHILFHCQGPVWLSSTQEIFSDCSRSKLSTTYVISNKIKLLFYSLLLIIILELLCMHWILSLFYPNQEQVNSTVKTSLSTYHTEKLGSISLKKRKGKQSFDKFKGWGSTQSRLYLKKPTSSLNYEENLKSCCLVNNEVSIAKEYCVQNTLFEVLHLSCKLKLLLCRRDSHHSAKSEMPYLPPTTSNSNVSDGLWF